MLRDAICVSFHFYVSRTGKGWKVFLFSFCLDMIALTVYRSRKVCSIECKSSCLVYQFCCSVLSNEPRFNVARRAEFVNSDHLPPQSNDLNQIEFTYSSTTQYLCPDYKSYFTIVWSSAAISCRVLTLLSGNFGGLP